MKLSIAFLTLCTTLLVIILSTFDLSITHFDNGFLIFIYSIITGIIFLIITSVINIIRIIKKEIVGSIIISNDYYHNKNIEKIQWVFDYLCATISGHENSIVDRVHNNNKILFNNNEIKLNNNLIETHTTHELLKELFMLENDTNRLLHFDVDNNQQDLFCKQVIEDSINNNKIKDIIIEDDKVTISKEENSRTINRRKKQQL